jgi:hypothetical protein
VRALDGTVVCDECLGTGLVACECAVCLLNARGECVANGLVQCDCRKPLDDAEFHALVTKEDG